MDNQSGRDYTAREAATNLVNLADHLKDFSGGDLGEGAVFDRKSRFCLECVGKHLLALRGLGAEGRDFFPEDAFFWSRLREWSDSTLSEVQQPLTVELAKKIERHARTFRKTIQARYMGRAGDCTMSATSTKGSCAIHTPGAAGYTGEAEGEDCECVTGFETCCRRAS